MNYTKSILLENLHEIRIQKILIWEEQKNKINQVVNDQIIFNKNYIMKTNDNLFLNSLLENNLIYDKITKYLQKIPNIFTDIYESLVKTIKKFTEKYNEEIYNLKNCINKENLKLKKLKQNYYNKIKNLEKKLYYEKDNFKLELLENNNSKFDVISKLNQKIKTLKKENNSLKTSLLSGSLNDLNFKFNLLNNKIKELEFENENNKKTINNNCKKNDSFEFYNEIDQIKMENKIFVQYNKENLKKIKSKNILLEEIEDKYVKQINEIKLNFNNSINELNDKINKYELKIKKLSNNNNELTKKIDLNKNNELEYLKIINELNLIKEKYKDKYKAIKIKKKINNLDE